MAAPPLAEVFRSRLGREPGSLPADLDDRLQALAAQARALLPDVAVDAAALAARAGELAGPEPDVAGFLAELHAADLALATACLAGDGPALARLDRMLAADVAPALRQVDPAASFADDVLQSLRGKLLLSDGGAPPRLVGYAGRGPLGGWLRVAAVRDAVSLKRRDRREVPLEDALAGLADPARSPADAILRASQRAALATALRAALAEQPARIRAALRMYYADDAGVEEIGRVYNVHASTISRWLTRAREEVLAATRRALARDLALAEADVDSTLGLANSLDLSLTALLGG